MSNWDLMMPGMGLTAIGLAGLTLSYAGIAHTFIDGMHALTGLTMFVGLIFLAVGILDGGISTSNKAKATTLVIISIALGFGAFALTLNTSDFTIVIAGILIAITFPAIIIAYLAMKHPSVVKPIGSIVAIAAATGIIMWVSFGFVSPDTYILPQQAKVIEPIIESKTPVFEIQIQESQEFEPKTATVTQGYAIQWTNTDSVQHTVTSVEGFGELFNSGIIDANETFELDTTELSPGKYEYQCEIHSEMIAEFIIKEPKEATKVGIPLGAAILQDGQIYYDPQNITISQGTTVSWENQDNTIHTVTSGMAGADTGLFDSSIIDADASYEFTFDDAGSYDYYCAFHTWMVGSINVE